MVLVHGLLVILDSRRFSSVEVRRWVGPCTMGESRLTNWVEISRQVSRRHGDRHGHFAQNFESYFIINKRLYCIWGGLIRLKSYWCTRHYSVRL